MLERLKMKGLENPRRYISTDYLKSSTTKLKNQYTNKTNRHETKKSNTLNKNILDKKIHRTISYKKGQI